MSNYTPTTEQICDDYCESFPEHMFYLKREQFYRWLTEHDRQKQAEAWHEGFVYAVEGINNDETVGTAENPYREGEK